MRARKFKVAVVDTKYPSYELERLVLSKLNAELAEFQCKTEDDIINNCKDVDALLTHHAPITRDVIESLERAKIIARYGIGVDNVDLEAATEKGIYVTNVVYDVRDVADHTVSLILSLIRKIPWIYQATKSGEWNWKKFQPIIRVKGKTIGIVGFGRVGREVAKRVSGFEVNIVAHDPYIPLEDFEKSHVVRMDFETILKQSDVITLHIKLTKETYHMIGENELRKMKKTAILINTCRGGVVDEEALYTALREKWIAGAGLDVLEKETLTVDNPLLELDNIIITPHIAWYSVETLPEIQTAAVEEVVRVLTGKLPLRLVNTEVLRRD